MADFIDQYWARELLGSDMAIAEEDVLGYRTKTRWQVWLDSVHDGGKKKVPNPNPATARRFPQVSFSSALKDDAFRAKAMEEFKKWNESNPASGSPGGPRQPKQPGEPTQRRRRGPPPPPPKPQGKPLSDDPNVTVTVGDMTLNISGATEEAMKTLFGDRPPTQESLAKMYTVPGFKSESRVRVYTNKMSIETNIYDANGSSVGTINRTYKKVGKKLVVHHDLLKLNSGSKGQGTGSTLLKNSFDGYREMGVNEVEQTCAWDGRYVWPRMGYKMKPKHFEKAKEHLKEVVAHRVSGGKASWNRTPGEKKAVADAMKWVDENVKDAQNIADLVMPDGTEVGKQSLLTGNWFDVTMQIKDGNPNYERMKKYLSGDKSRPTKKVDVTVEEDITDPGSEEDWGEEIQEPEPKKAGAAMNDYDFTANEQDQEEDQEEEDQGGETSLEQPKEKDDLASDMMDQVSQQGEPLTMPSFDQGSDGGAPSQGQEEPKKASLSYDFRLSVLSLTLRAARQKLAAFSFQPV